MVLFALLAVAAPGLAECVSPGGSWTAVTRPTFMGYLENIEVLYYSNYDPEDETTEDITLTPVLRQALSEGLLDIDWTRVCPEPIVCIRTQSGSVTLTTLDLEIEANSGVPAALGFDLNRNQLAAAYAPHTVSTSSEASCQARVPSSRVLIS